MSPMNPMKGEKEARNECTEALVAKIEYLLSQFEDDHVARQLDPNEVAQRWEAGVWDWSQKGGSGYAAYYRDNIGMDLDKLKDWEGSFAYGSGKKLFIERLRRLYPTHFSDVPTALPLTKAPKSRVGVNANANVATDTDINTPANVNTSSNVGTHTNATGYTSLAAKEDAMLSANGAPDQNISVDDRERWQTRKCFRESIDTLLKMYDIGKKLDEIEIRQLAASLECVVWRKKIENPDNDAKYINEVEDIQQDFDTWTNGDGYDEFRKFIQKQPDRPMEVAGLVEVIGDLVKRYPSHDEMSIVNVEQLAIAWELQIWHDTYVKNEILGEYQGALMNACTPLENYKEYWHENKQGGLTGEEKFRRKIKRKFPDLFVSAVEPLTRATAQQKLDDELYDLGGGNDTNEGEQWENVLTTDNAKNDGSGSELSECLSEFDSIYGTSCVEGNANNAGGGLSTNFLENKDNNIETPASPSPSQQGCSDEDLKQQGAFDTSNSLALSNPTPQTDITGSSGTWSFPLLPGIGSWAGQQGFNTNSGWSDNALDPVPQTQPHDSTFQPYEFQQNLNTTFEGFSFTTPQTEQPHESLQPFLPQPTTNYVSEESDVMDGIFTGDNIFLTQLPSPQESTNGLFEDYDTMGDTPMDQCLQELVSNQHSFLDIDDIDHTDSIYGDVNGSGFAPDTTASFQFEPITAPASQDGDEEMIAAPAFQGCDHVEYSDEMEFEQYDPVAYSNYLATSSDDHIIHNNDPVADNNDPITNSSDPTTYSLDMEVDSRKGPQDLQSPGSTVPNAESFQEDVPYTHEEAGSTMKEVMPVYEATTPVHEIAAPPISVQEEAAPIEEAIHDCEEFPVHEETAEATVQEQTTPPEEKTATVQETTVPCKEEAVTPQDDAAPFQENAAPAQEATNIQEPVPFRFDISGITIGTVQNFNTAAVKQKVEVHFGVNTADLSALMRQPVKPQAALPAPKAPQQPVKHTLATPSPKPSGTSERKVAPTAPQKEAVKADKKKKKKQTKKTKTKTERVGKPQKDAVVVPEEPNTRSEAYKMPKLFAQIRAFQDEWQIACKAAAIPRDLQDYAQTLFKEHEKWVGKKDEWRIEKQLQKLVRRWEVLRKAADGFHRLRLNFSNENQTAMRRAAKGFHEHMANKNAYFQADGRAREVGNRALADRWESMAVERARKAEKSRCRAKESLDVLTEDYVFYQHALEDLLLFFPDEELRKRLEEMASMTLKDYHGRIKEAHGMFGFAFENVTDELDYGEL